jgi:hypothetical protein
MGNVARACVVCALAVLSATAIGGAPSQAAHAKGHQVTVFTSYGLVAKFKSAKCHRRHGGFDLVTPERDGGYSLFVSIQNFDPKQDVYPVTQGKDDPFVSVVQHGSDLRYNNVNVPPFPAPALGEIRFDPKDPKLVGVGYSPAFTSDASDAATITGVLTCKYPKRRRG